MINLIIWSKDRACQLDLLLRSIAEYAPNIFSPTIIYKYSNESYRKAYDKLKDSQHILDNTFLHETDFYTDNIGLIKNPIFDHISFSTDDTVIYKPFPIKPYFSLVKYLPKNDSEVFSFRLGLNTIVQDLYNQLNQPALNRYVKIDECVYWNALEYSSVHNYGYPFGLDLHVYRRTLLEGLLSKIGKFNSSNELETKLFKYRTCANYMGSFRQSVAVNIPVNNMSGITQAGMKHSYTNEFLNSQYLSGLQVSLEEISKVDVVGSHQEIPFVWEES